MRHERGFLERRFQAVSIKTIDSGIADNGNGTGTSQAPHEVASPVEEAVFNMNIIGIRS